MTLLSISHPFLLVHVLIRFALYLHFFNYIFYYIAYNALRNLYTS